MSANNYKQAIEAVSSENVDWRQVAIEVAKMQPATFNEAVKRTKPWIGECKALRDGPDTSKVDAIKLWRSMTGDGLKEAKEAVEAL